MGGPAPVIPLQPRGGSGTGPPSQLEGEELPGRENRTSFFNERERERDPSGMGETDGSPPCPSRTGRNKDPEGPMPMCSLVQGLANFLFKGPDSNFRLCRPRGNIRAVV